MTTLVGQPADLPVGTVDVDAYVAWRAELDALLAEFDHAPEDIKARVYALTAAKIAEVRGRIEYDLRTAAAVATVRAWREQARPDQLPPDCPWRLAYLRGGRGSGKTWAAARWFAEDLLDYPGGEWGIVAPTFSDARELCIEGPSGLLVAFGTTVSEVEAGRSLLVAKWNRSSNAGELYLRPEVGGGIVYIGGALDGALAVQGKNLRGLWGDEVGKWKGDWSTAWSESIRYAVRMSPAHRIATGTPKRRMAARALVKLLLHGKDGTPPADVQRRLRTVDNLANLDPGFADEMLTVLRAGGPDAAQEIEGELLEVGGTVFRTERVRREPDWPREARLVRFWDLAATEPNPKNEDPDWTAGALVALFQGRWWIVDVVRRQSDPHDIKTLIAATLRRDEDLLTPVATRMELEGGSSGKTVIDEYRRSVFVGRDFDGQPSRVNKVERATPVATAVGAGNVTLVDGPWNETLLEELEAFPDPNVHDDQVDALSGAFAFLSGAAAAPMVRLVSQDELLRGRR